MGMSSTTSPSGFVVQTICAVAMAKRAIASLALPQRFIEPVQLGGALLRYVPLVRHPPGVLLESAIGPEDHLAQPAN